MTSAGNDIVCLNTIDVARTKQYRFYSKILSGTEIELYNETAFAAIPFENFVWLLWSIKESAYKYLQRNNPGLVFTPVKFIIRQLRAPGEFALTKCENTETESTGFDDSMVLKGIVTFGDVSLYSMSLMHNDLVHSVVNDNEDFKNICWGIKSIDSNEPDYQSTAVRSFLLNRLNRYFRMEGLAIVKNQHGVPIVIKENEVQPIPVSLSHHGRFVAYSFISRF
ncbi:MAG: 4'-phosphopantetheinyl transferase superfamily protein [Sphingobacteriales bacterium]